MSATTLYLVRHGAHDLLGRILCGRAPGVGLNGEGEAQAARIARRLAGASLQAVYASPVQRAVETAAPLARACDLDMRIDDDLAEVEFGEWTGASFDDLADRPEWERWNLERDACRPPSGESMAEVQSRIRSWMGRAMTAAPGGAVAAFSHADVIKAAIAGVLDWSLRGHGRLEISPGSISVLVAGDWGARVHSINEVPA